MNKEQLFESMCGIDEQLLQRSEKTAVKSGSVWKYCAALAACFCLLAAAAAVIPGFLPENEPVPSQKDPLLQSTEGKTEPTEVPAYALEVYYNDAEAVLAAERAVIPGYFTEELSARELVAVTPEKQIEWMGYSGTAGFDGEGKLIQVSLRVTTTLPESDVKVVLGDTRSCCVIEPTTILSPCGDMEYAVYQRETGVQNITLEASAQIDKVPLAFSMTVSEGMLDQAKADFEAVLECFAWYAEGKPDLSAVTADVIPEWFDLKLDLAQAQQDADFGSFMPSTLPSGFAEESVRRYKDQNSDYLSGLWTRGLDEIYWNVSYYEEADAVRLTAIEDTKNYDLSLYPIPRAESVPEELHEIVGDPIFDIADLNLDAVQARAYKVDDAGDSDGWRMHFSVKYGDKIVSISTKGVDPQWLYDQLKALQ